MAGDEEVEVESAATHVCENFDGGRCCSFGVCCRGLLVLAVFVEYALQDCAVAFGYFPVLAHACKCVDEEHYVLADGARDGGAVDEKEARGYPECEGEGRPESV